VGRVGSPRRLRPSGVGHGRAGFAADVRVELARLFRAPRMELQVVVFNAAIVCIGWVFLPGALKQCLFDNVSGPMSFVIVLETWMLGDVTSTNLLAHDRPGALVALRHSGGIRHLLRVKATALAVVIGVPSAVAALVIGIAHARLLMALMLVPLFLVLPLAVVGVASWLGVVLPFRPRPLRWRWEHRRVSGTIRWAFLVLVPYTVANALVSVLVFTPRLFAYAITRHVPHVAHPSASALAVLVLGGATLSLVVFTGATVIGDRLARVRRRALVGHLEDPHAV
jgi:hypothetical protein